MLEKERVHSDAWMPPWLHHQHVARYEWALEYCRGVKVLDAACGSGYGSRILTREAEVISVDIAVDAIADARRGGSSAPLRLMLADTTALPFETGSFGAYASFETIEHVRDDRSYVAEARRVVANGGVFLCSTPNRVVVNPGNTIADAPFNRFHIREYSASELHSKLRESFADVVILGQTPYAGPYVTSLGRVGRVWKMAAVRLHQIRKVLSVPFDSAGAHWPGPPVPGTQPEVLIAICR